MSTGRVLTLQSEMYFGRTCISDWTIAIEQLTDGDHLPALKNILQSKLHNPWIFRGSDLTENATVETRNWIVQVKRICNIERLRPKFQLLCFTQLECSGKGRIELPGARAANAARPNCSECS